MKDLADIVDGIIKDPVKNDVENKIKALINGSQAKITDIVIKKEGGLIVKTALDDELKKIDDKIDMVNLNSASSTDAIKHTIAFLNILGVQNNYEKAAENVKKRRWTSNKNPTDNC